MSMIEHLTRVPSGLARRLERIRRNTSGVSAIEFALIVPLMITLYIGVVEVSHALTVDRRVTTVASAAADLVAQADELTDDDLTDIFNAVSSILQPYSTDPITIVLTSVVADENNDTTVGWSRGFNGGAPHAQDAEFTVPEGLTQPFSSVIVAEVTYNYQPPIGKIITSNISLEDTFYLRPRRSLVVCLNGCDE